MEMRLPANDIPARPGNTVRAPLNLLRSCHNLQVPSFETLFMNTEIIHFTILKTMRDRTIFSWSSALPQVSSVMRTFSKILRRDF